MIKRFNESLNSGKSLDNVFCVYDNTENKILEIFDTKRWVLAFTKIYKCG